MPRSPSATPSPFLSPPLRRRPSAACSSGRFGSWTDAGVDDAGAPRIRFDAVGNYTVQAGTRPAGLGAVEQALHATSNWRQLRLVQPTSALGAYEGLVRYALVVDDKVVDRNRDGYPPVPAFDISTACYRSPSSCPTPLIAAGTHRFEIRGYLPGQNPDDTTDPLRSELLVADLCGADGGAGGGPGATDGGVIVADAAAVPPVAPNDAPQIGGGSCSAVPGEHGFPVGALVASGVAAFAVLRRRQRKD